MIGRAAMLGLVLATVPAAAHEVTTQVSVGDAVVVTLRYADGTPFAHEEAEIRRAADDRPLFLTRSDAEGRVVFLADQGEDLLVRAFSADGHGATVRVDAAALAGSSVMTTTSPWSGLVRVFAGVATILALFFCLTFMARSRRKPGDDHET